MPANLNHIDIENSVHTVSGYTAGKYWGSPSGAVKVMSRLSVYGSAATALTLTETNDLFQDLDDSDTIWQNSTLEGGKVINYKGVTPTGAGLTAKNNLINNKGVVVTNIT